MAKNPAYLLKISWITTGILAVLHFLPFLLNGDNAYIRLHDTLEGELVWLKLLVDNHVQWDLDPSATVPQVMNGLPRAAFPTGLSVNVVFVWLFGMYWGYFANRALVHVVAFLAMYILLKNHYIRDKERRYIVVLVSLVFSLVPVFSVFGLSVAGQPLVLNSFLYLREKIYRWKDFLWLAFFPFYSSIVWAAIPLLTCLGLIFLYDWIRKKQFNWGFLIAVVMMGLIYGLVNYPIFMLSFFNKEFVPHRDAYNVFMYWSPSIKGVLEDALLLFLTSHYHVGIFISLPVIIAIALTGKLRDRENRPAFIMFLIFLVSAFQGFYPMLEYWIGDSIGFVKSFRMNRFNILVPFMWCLALAITLGLFHRSSLLKAYILPFIAVQLLITFLSNDEMIHNYRKLAGIQTFPMFHEYMADEQFSEIDRYIGEPKENYRVISLGLSPTIAQYNGFYTLDGLQSVYDLNYKKKFREIFRGEIEKSPAIEEYFDGWGNRCYMFSSELGKEYPAFMVHKTDGKVVKNLWFDANSFRELGGKFVISAVEIQNHDTVGLEFVKKFENNSSWWDIYLYRVKAAYNE